MKITGRQPYVQSPDGYRFPMSVRQGLTYLDARPVRDEEWEKLPHSDLTTMTEWDPSLYDGEIDPKWSQQQPNLVDDHYKKLPYNRYGEMDAEIATAVTEEETSDEEDYGEGAITVGEVEANLTELISDELVDSVIEFEINGVVYHRHVDSDDEEYDWGDWQDEESVTWTCYDVRGRRRSSRRRAPASYSDTRQRGTKTKSAVRGSRSRRDSRAGPNVVDIINDQDDRIAQDDRESHDVSEDEEPRTDYYNKAKSTTQNEDRVVGLYLGKPSKVHYGEIGRAHV